jgi:hypothetical protein
MALEEAGQSKEWKETFHLLKEKKNQSMNKIIYENNCFNEEKRVID